MQLHGTKMQVPTPASVVPENCGCEQAFGYWHKNLFFEAPIFVHTVDIDISL
jgi:hypothetical protein